MTELTISLKLSRTLLGALNAMKTYKSYPTRREVVIIFPVKFLVPIPPANDPAKKFPGHRPL